MGKLRPLTEETAKSLISSFESVSASVEAFNKALAEAQVSIKNYALSSKLLDLLTSFGNQLYRSQSWFIFKGYWRRRAAKTYAKFEKLVADNKVECNVIRTPWRLIVSDLNYVPFEGLSSMEKLDNGNIVSYLSFEEYNKQLKELNANWRCPVTHKMDIVTPDGRSQCGTHNLTFDGPWFMKSSPIYKDGEWSDLI